VAVAWHNLARLEGQVDKLTDVITGPALAILLLKGEQVVETLLVGQTVKWSSKTVHTRSERKVRV